MRLIDADALKKVIEEIYFSGKWLDFRINRGSNGVRDVILDLVTNAPAVDAIVNTIEVKPQGEWINHRNDYGHNIADCSLCGKAMQWHDEDEDGIPRFCWYCGAKMKDGAEE